MTPEDFNLGLSALALALALANCWWSWYYAPARRAARYARKRGWHLPARPTYPARGWHEWHDGSPQ